MTHPKSVEEILAEVMNTGIPGKFEPNEYGKKKIAQAKQSLLKLILEHPTRPRFSDDDEVWDEITRIYDTFLRELLTAPQQKEKL